MLPRRLPLDQCRRRVQQATRGHRGQQGDPLYAAQRVLHTGADLLIASISTEIPSPLRELITLGRTLKRRAVDVPAYFDRPGTSSGPTEAINGRLEHLRGSALGFRNLTNYTARSLLEAWRACRGRSAASPK